MLRHQRSASGVATRLPGASSQPGNIDRLIPQRDLVFAARWCHQLVDQPGPFVGTALGQIRQSAPQLRMFQRGGAAESPQADSDPVTRCPRW